jgi:hypothetical protein
MPKKLILSIVLVLVLLNVGLFGYYYYNYIRNGGTNSPNSTQLAAPQELLLGKVTKKEGNIFMVETLSESGLKTFSVTISPSTKIQRKAQIIPYLFKIETPQEVVSAAESEIVEGVPVEVVTRDLSNDQVTADVITLPRATYLLEGKIAEVGATNVIVDGAPVIEVRYDTSPESYQPQAHRRYTVTVSSETEISRVPGAEDPTKVPPKKFELSELTVGQEVIVYAQTDVITNLEFTAARIEPII